MQQFVSDLKNEMEVIDAVGIYDFSSNSYLYTDDNLGSIDFIETMIDADCFISCDYIYFDWLYGSFFIKQHGAHNFVVIRYNKAHDVNKIVLEHQVGKFCSVIFQA